MQETIVVLGSLCLLGGLFYHRANRFIFTSAVALWLVLLSVAATNQLGLVIAWLCFGIIFIPLNVTAWRKNFFSQPLFNFYLKIMPRMSRTEREAINSGTVTWEGDLFRGNPNWHKMLNLPSAKLSAEEQAFLDGPVEKLCAMINDWDITHNRADLPPDVWQYLKDQGFFSLIIPKQYGGKEFSAYAHSQILVKISGRSLTASSTVAVPNSLGPAELLLHYGTQEQKDYYLPRLARGEEIPCFALTSAEAGSDAGAMTDHGVVVWGEHEGRPALGIELNFSKRYITLAPVATVIGLAFKLYDPNHLLGSETEIGITCALIPRNTPGLIVGRRHFPLNTPFQNGPVSGKNIFIPVNYIIGGKERAGQGWRMLMECLAAGRAISLPASALGGAKVLAYSAGAYARIRHQFNLPIGKFEGVQEPLARIAGLTYLMDATRTLAAASIDSGEKPAVASAIVKYHVTEMGRAVACDGMDIHGGKGICLGPHNYLGRAYQAAPIGITVEGANILTRSMIIFGQGVIRCHPYVLAEIEAARIEDKAEALKAFDKAITQHIAFGISNIVRSLFLGLTAGYLVITPKSKLKRYYQQTTRFSSALALIADVAMLRYGGNLKRKESISARLGDILSYLYIISAALKQFHRLGEPQDDLPVLNFACQYCLYQIAERFKALIRHFTPRPLGMLLNFLIFPLGNHYLLPADDLHSDIANLLMQPGLTRDNLAQGAYLGQANNLLTDVQDALIKSIAAESIEKIIREAEHKQEIFGYTQVQLAQAALAKKLISLEQFDIIMQADEARKKLINVDDFVTEDLIHAKTAEPIKNAGKDSHSSTSGI